MSDKLILEFINRVINLEVRVDELEKKLEDKQISLQEQESDEILDELTRASAREIAIEKLKEANPGIDARIAKRSEGSGIVVTKNEKDILVKFYYSKIHEKSNSISWSGVFENDIKDRFNFFVFAINDNELGLQFLVFNKTQLENLLKDRLLDSEKKFHLSFCFKEDKLFEVRGKEDVDVSFTTNKFKLDI